MSEKARHDSTARTRELGLTLRGVRKRKQLGGRELNRKVGWPDCNVSFWETGRRAPSSVDVATFLAGCGPLDRIEYEQLIAMAKEPDNGYWVRPHNPELPTELRSLIVAESIADSIASYEPAVIPGLLQTEQYIRELFRWCSTRTQGEIELRVQARLARQELLRRDQPPDCTYFIQEHALRTVLGSSRVMNEQLLHLVFAGSLPRCTIRVVREAAGPFSAWGGMFMLLEQAEHPATAYTEGLAAGTFLDKAEDITRYRGFLARLDANALNEGQSRAWLASLASAYDRAEAGSSCPPPSKPG
ncbi:DUF5753 domain-containing protein [Amycolatopsis nigrescens]|uniref:DUF5753 domain-containing protein n=1 Tax=Amycolatopsis nigrescens TaxID=381445 RepID=UPI00036424C1|nr:DUF5753 domain-containing protein [Amycolatopsis nigrescens]